MRRKYSRIIRWLTVFSWVLMLMMRVSSTVLAQISPVEISTTQHGIIDIAPYLDDQVTEVTIDTTLIGGASAVPISPELGKVTVKADAETVPGEYELPVTIERDNGEDASIMYPVNVVAPEADERAFDEEVIYFLLTDRFKDGNPDNNNPFDLPYASAENQRGIYQGGDFQGITDAMAYLSNLGVTTVWISPIVLNILYDASAGSTDPEYYAYHGYWALDFEELNPHFGTLEEFHNLIDTAASYDIKIMVDVVLNHTGYGLGSNDSILDVPGFPTSEDRARFEEMLRETPGSDDITMALSGLPDFVTEDARVREQLVDWQTAWVEMSRTNQGNQIASYRVDTVNHVDRTLLQHFKNELVALNPAFNLIGESWGADSRNPKGFLHSGQMDSVLDFSFKDIAAQFANGQLDRVNQRMIERNEALNSSGTVGQFLSSHDEVGFLYKLHGNEGKAMLAASLQLTAKGQPIIYYGEELGQTGANNWPIYDNRYDFAWDQVEDNPMLKHYQRLLQFRQQYSAILARGNRVTVAGSTDEHYLAIERQYQGESVYVLFNSSDAAQEVTIPLPEGSYVNHYDDTQLEATEDGLLVTIPSLSEGGTALIAPSIE